jgi:hypothetical protein
VFSVPWLNLLRFNLFQIFIDMKTFRLIMLSILAPWCAFAWNGSGHMTAGAIAYYYLKAHDPATLQKVLATIKLHPWYGQQHWKDTLAKLPKSQQDVGLFMLASTYPDDAKTVPHYPDGDATHKMWHYIDYPFVPAGQNVTPLPPETPNAQIKIDELLTAIPTLQDSPDKAVDLAWLFHLVEDIHQPLHTSALFDVNHPKGDAGGNTTFYTFGTGSGLVLHAYWDGLVKGSLTTYAGNAQKLLKKAKYHDDKLPELTQYTTPDDWITKESSPDAQQIAYQQGKVNGTKSSPTVLNSKYASAASTLGERRVVLAGIRMAKLLTKLYA